MINSLQKIMMEFESKADKLFAYQYNQFDKETLILDRDQDENVFQQSAARYTYALKYQLNLSALALIDKFGHTISDLSHVQQMLTKRIAAYVNEFNQRTKI